MSQKKQQTDSMLYCVGLMVDQHLRSAGDQSASNTVPQELSYLTLGWLGLKEAFQCWQMELADVCGIQGFGMEGLRIDTFLNDAYAQYPEFQYLINLKQAPNSWLDILLKKTTRVGDLSTLNSELHSADTFKSLPEAGQIKRIELTNISETNEETAKDQFLRVYSQAQSYISDVRERQQEW